MSYEEDLAEWAHSVHMALCYRAVQDAIARTRAVFGARLGIEYLDEDGLVFRRLR
jgi:hypothetical protein